MSRPGRRRTSSTSRDFLWVNRTPDSGRLSATRQERDELRTITSHARSWRAALRRQQRLYHARTEATHAQSIVGWGRPGAVSETSSAETSAAPSPAAMTQITGNSTDPFIYAEAPDDAWWSHDAFYFATNSWLPFVFQDVRALDVSLSVSTSYTGTVERIIRSCLENRMHMFSLLAASSGYMKFILRLQLGRHDAPEYCMGKALQHLRHHLAADDPQPDEILVFDLGALATFERYVGNFEGARTHLRMVQHLVQSIGGMAMLDPPLQSICRLWDLSAAGGADEAPLMQLNWDPGTPPLQRMHDEILPVLTQSGTIPSGSGLVERSSMVQPELVTIISDVVQWFQVQQFNHLSNNSGSSLEQWATPRSYALVHRLLSLCPNLPGDPTQMWLSQCIRQSIFIVIADMEVMAELRANPSALRDPTICSWSNVNRLRHALSNLIQSEGDWLEQHREIVLWMACHGIQQTRSTIGRTVPAQSPSAGDDEDDAQDWFIRLARECLYTRRRQTRSSSSLATLDDLIHTMSRYLHRCDPSGQPDMTGLEGLDT